MTHLAYDAETPNPNGIAGTDTVLIYIGGDAAHVWTDQEIAEQPERWRLPTFVRDFSGVDPNRDGAVAISWLQTHNVPKGSSVVLDLEGLIDPPYVTGFGNDLHAAGYHVLPYGEGHSLFSNPQLDGYFLSEPGATAIDPRCVATQFQFSGSYDLSWIAASVSLWDTQPPSPPPPPPQESSMPVSPLVSFRASQQDIIQVNANSVIHKWVSTGNVLHSECLAGPLTGVADNQPVTFPEQTPGVSIVNGACQVTVEDSSGRVHQFAQAQTGPWGHNIFP